MNKIQKLEKRYLELLNEHARLMAKASEIGNKKDRAFARFAGACRSLLRANLRKKDVLFMRDRGGKFIVKEAGRFNVSCMRPKEYKLFIFPGGYHDISSVRRNGRIVYKNGEWIGRKNRIIK